MTDDYYKIMATIRRAENRIQEAYRDNDEDRRIREIEQEHIDRLRDMLAEPMSVDILEDSFI